LNKATAGVKNVLECISTVSAELKYSSIEPQVESHFRSFEVEVVPESHLEEF
jgi:hypothetical protein